MTQKNSVTFSSKPNHAARQAHMQARQMFSEYDTSQIAPKKSKLPLIFGSLIAVVVVLAVVGLVMHFFAGSGNSSDELLPPDQTAIVTVVPGDDVEIIGITLKQVGLISDSRAFVKRVQKLGAESTLQAGTYEIPGGTSIDDIIKILQEGSWLSGTRFTVPEGWSIKQMAARLEQITMGRITAADFLEAAQAPKWVDEFAFTQYAGEESLEGMLFPATYGVETTATAEDVVRMMLTKFEEVVRDLDPSYAYDRGLSFYQWVMLASIIQAEAAAGDEATVASVFYNRMAQDMPLQSDATTAYSVDGLPTPEQLADYSDPYNTYSYDRLGVCIPTPIGNPGLAALEAACHPEETDYLFFLSYTDENDEVKTVFSTTYEEHQAAIDKYL